MSLIAVRRASSAVRLVLAAVFALPSTGVMPAGGVALDGVIYGCPMGGDMGGGGMHAMPTDHAGHDVSRGDVEPGPAGDDGDGCHCRRDCGCPAAAEAGASPSLEAGLRLPIVVRVEPASPVTVVALQTPRALLPPPTGPPVISA